MPCDFPLQNPAECGQHAICMIRYKVTTIRSRDDPADSAPGRPIGSSGPRSIPVAISGSRLRMLMALAGSLGMHAGMAILLMRPVSDTLPPSWPEPQTVALVFAPPTAESAAAAPTPEVDVPPPASEPLEAPVPPPRARPATAAPAARAHRTDRARQRGATSTGAGGGAEPKYRRFPCHRRRRQLQL